MNNNLNHITGLITKSLRFLFFIFLLSYPLRAQSLSNLEKFYILVDSATSNLIYDLGNTNEAYLNLNLGEDFSVFSNQVRGKLLRSGIKLLNDKSSSQIIIDFTIDDCVVSYGEPKRDGWFGDYYSERTVKLSGNYFITNLSQVKNFIIEDSDIIKVEEVDKLENRSFPFTRGELPPEPFFSSLIEPIIVVGAAAITIILFFSVRSK
jgi:hypothetical protein